LEFSKKQEAKIKTAEIKFLSVAGYTKKDKIINTKIKKELNVFN
jgi:hypothetical protein